MEIPVAPVPRAPPPQPAERTSKSRFAAGLSLFTLAGFCVGVVLAKLFSGTPEEEIELGVGWILGVLALVPFLWLVAVGMHELGHLVGGWLTGGRFLLWAAGPVFVHRTPTGIRAAWNARINAFGGLAACLPADPAAATPGRVAVMVAGGPTFSLLLCAAASGAAIAYDQFWTSSPSFGFLIEGAAKITAALSAVIFAISAAPFTAAGFKSDGRRFLDLLRRGARADQEAALIILTTAALAGVRPSCFDPALVQRVLALQDGSLFDLFGRIVAYSWAADRGDWAAAQTFLDQVMVRESTIAPPLRALVRCEYAWLMATRAQDAVGARAWLDSAGPTHLDPSTRLRAEAAVLLAEGRFQEAAAKAREGLRALDTQTTSPVRSAFAADALEDILRRAGAAADPA